MPFEIRDPDAQSCNMCPSFQAIVKLCFVSEIPGGKGSTSTNVRLCSACFKEMHDVLCQKGEPHE